jgi:DTW domain-containing protein YfiP
VVFLRHFSERDRLTNTGHWASLALAGSRVLEQGVPGEPLDGSGLSAPGTWLLYPSPHPPPADAPPPRRIVVPDGTWAQARRIVHRVPELRGLPRLPLPPQVAPAGVRRPPRRGNGVGGMSTLEAVASALRVLGDTAAADRLEALLADGVALVERLGRVPEAHAGGSPRGRSRAKAGGGH